MSSVEEYLKEKMKKGTVHITLLDPDKQSSESAGKLAFRMKEAGTDAFFIGGSTGVTTENLSATARAVKAATDLPVIYFPSNPKAISKDVDCIVFMSILNAGDPLYVTRGQAMAAAYIKSLGVECIPMAYIIVEPGMTVGRVTKAVLIPHDDPKTAVGYAVAAELFGMRLVYLEAGSGADRPVDPAMIAAVKKHINVPLIIGGGIRTPEAAAAAHKAGANIIVTGTFVETCSDEGCLKAVVSAAKGV